MEQKDLEKKIEEARTKQINNVINNYEKGINRVYPILKASIIYTQYLPAFYDLFDVGQYYL